MTLSIQQIEELLSKIETESVYPDPWEDTSCDIIRQLIKEAAASFGWFSLKTLGVIGAGGLIWLALIADGWHK